MGNVRMVNPSDGGVYEFDERFAKDYAAKGWRPDSGSVPNFGGAASDVSHVGASQSPPDPAQETGMLSFALSNPGEDIARKVLGALEPLMGTAGGMFGGGIPGATLGGMAGKGLEAAGLKAAGLEQPGGGVARNILQGGANQGLQELLGLGLGKGLGAVGKGINRYGAVRPSPALLSEFPDVMETINKERFPVGSAEKPALEAGARRRASGAALDESLAKVDAAGITHTLDPKVLPPEVRKQVARVAGGKDAADRVAAIRQAWSDAVANARSEEVGGAVLPEKARLVVAPIGRGAGGNVTRKQAAETLAHHEHMVAIGRKSSQPLVDAWQEAIDAADKSATQAATVSNKAKVSVTPTQTQGLKRSHQGEGATINKAERKGALVPPGTKVDAETDKAIGQALRRMQHSLPEEFGIAARDKRTQSLIGAEKAIAASERRGSPRFPMMFGSPGALANVALEPLGRPSNLSAIARGLMHPATAAVAGQVPRVGSLATGMSVQDLLNLMQPQQESFPQ